MVATYLGGPRGNCLHTEEGLSRADRRKSYKDYVGRSIDSSEMANESWYVKQTCLRLFVNYGTRGGAGRGATSVMTHYYYSVHVCENAVAYWGRVLEEQVFSHHLVHVADVGCWGEASGVLEKIKIPVWYYVTN